MKKQFLITFILAFFTTYSNAQIDDVIARRKVDSVNKVIKSAKGKNRVDCLNLLAESYRWIWDDNDKHLDTACMYANQALEEAKRINYKAGIAYAKHISGPCNGGRIDHDRNNNGLEPAYRQMYKQAEEVLTLAGQIKDDYLSGMVYYYLAWCEKWWGAADKFKSHTEKALEHFEKIKGDEFKDRYKPLMMANCSDCKGTELMLGWLYQDMANTIPGINSTKEGYLEKSISNYKKAGEKSYLPRVYLALANMHGITGKTESTLYYFNEAIALFRDDKNEYGETDAYNAICAAFFNWGDFEKGIEYSKKNIFLSEKLARIDNRQLKNNRLFQAYYWMGRFYSIADDVESAFAYMRKALYHAPNENTEQNGKTAIAEFHRSLGNFDSSMYYLSFTLNNDIGIGKRILTGLYISMKEYDKGLDLINGWAKNRIPDNDFANRGKTHTLAAKAYYGKNDYDNALINARAGLYLLKKISYNPSLAENYQLLSDIFYKLGKNDSAYIYLKQYTALKDSLLRKQLYIKLNDYKKEAEDAKRIGQINLLQKDNLIQAQQLQQQILLKAQNDAQLTLLDKENEIKDQQLLIQDQKIKEQTLQKEQNQSQLTILDRENKLKSQQIKQQATIRNALLGGLFLFLLLGVFVIRTLSLKRKNEKLGVKKEQAELQQKVAELEMKALRAQMNPHFIFNCLSSINRFIFKNDNKVASDYLTRFSRLIRMVLIHSQKKLIPLEDELEMLRLYLDLERLRFKDSFDYSITTTNIADPGAVFIPPLLLQPFCENSVWHGLMNKDSKGSLLVKISEDTSGGNKVLRCDIEDDGVGLEKAAALKSKSAESHKSLGLKITTERLALLNQENDYRTFYKIEDILDNENKVMGTRVRLKMKYKENIEELV